MERKVNRARAENYDGDENLYGRFRSLSEPGTSFDKSAINERRYEAFPFGKSEYKCEFTEKLLAVKLPQIRRPSNIEVEAYPFSTSLYKSDSTLNWLNYSTEYDSNYHLLNFSPIIGRNRYIRKYNDGFNVVSKYNNPFKSYNEYINDTPIKKQDNLYMRSVTHI